MSESYQRNRVVVKLGLDAALFALLALAASPVLALAQSDCDTQELSREGNSEHRLAIKIGKRWKPFPPNRTGSAYPLEVGDPESELCMAWEAPPALGRQVVYVSTRFSEQEHMSLSRRGFLLGEGRSNLGRLDVLVDGFKTYHQRVPGGTTLNAAQDNPEPAEEQLRTQALQEHLDSWHDRRTSYDVVANAVAVPGYDLPYGSERLLTLLPLRPWKSWARIRARVLEGNTLRVAVAYSGDSSDPTTYEYIFEIR